MRDSLVRASDRPDLDLSIARARIALSLATLLSIYIDPAVGGLFTIAPPVLAALFCHLAYGLVVHEAVRRRVGGAYLPALSAMADVFFAVILAVFTEGHTSPAFAFFAFAIIAVGCRAGLRTTLVITSLSMLLYFLLILFLARETRDLYLMRPAYLAVTGYLIGFLGQQRARFDAQRAERQNIARALHDGYAQGLAGINLRLETARELLRRERAADAQLELAELQAGVAMEFDRVRAYIRALAAVDAGEGGHAALATREPYFHVRADVAGSGQTVEHVLQIVLEGLRNTRRHGRARSGTIQAVASGPTVRITIDDDGIGFPQAMTPPWSIASRVAELGGRCQVVEDGRLGAHLEIEMPAGSPA
jgi:signal transduction histidine kinase